MGEKMERENKLSQKELAKERLEKYKRYLLISRIAFAITLGLGIGTIIIAIVDGKFKFFILGGMLIALSNTWRIVGLEWKDKVIRWGKLSNDAKSTSPL